MTAAIFFAMAALATVSKRDFSFLGKFLFIGLVLLIVASLANLFFQVPALSLTISAIAVLIFSLYLLFDVQSIVRGGETNYIIGDAEAVPGRLQHLHQPAEHPARVLGAAPLTKHRRNARRRGDRIAPFLFVSAVRARTPRSTRRAPCAGTC